MAITPIDSDLVRQLLDRTDAVENVRSYFDDDSPTPFSGRHFERLGGGGDSVTIGDRFDAVDLLAVETLSVQVPPEVSAAILGGRGSELSALLAQIPTDLPIWEASTADLDEDSPAHRLWTAFESSPGVGWVTAGKLLARKRPRLIPVYDNVVKTVLKRTDGGFWLAMRDLLQDEAIRGRLAEIRAEAGNADDISELRILDVVLWRAGKAAGLG